MRIELTAYTADGCALAEHLSVLLQAEGFEARFCPGRGINGVKAADWVAECFPKADALIFVGACGIAVRSIAPHLTSKLSDPAVLVIDDQGKYVISLLSGHVGGANRLARRISALTGAEPVITTATDGHKLFAIDTWAAEHGFFIENPEKIKMVSGHLLDGNLIGLQTEFEICGELPKGFFRANESSQAAVSVRRPNENALWIVPPILVLGVGCRKGISVQALEEAFSLLLNEECLSAHAFVKVCSIDLKAGEPGLVTFCQSHKLPFVTASSQQLAAVPGTFSASAFVKSVTGVENVCERSAVWGSNGRILIPKRAGNGVTMAVAIGDIQLKF